MGMEFTGERVVEGETPQRIWLDHVARYEFASGYVKEKFVLDIACGTGYGSSILCRGGAGKVIGVDVSDETINFGRTKYKEKALEFKVGDILDIDFAEETFDVITCFETVEHVKSPEKVLAELQRVLKPDGLLIISSPNRKLTSPGKSIGDYPDNLFHVKEHTSGEFVLLLKKYFELLEVYGQRAKNKILFIPLLERIMKKIFPMLYVPEKSSPKVEKILYRNEYRYIVVVCKNKSNKP